MGHDRTRDCVMYVLVKVIKLSTGVSLSLIVVVAVAVSERCAPLRLASVNSELGSGTLLSMLPVPVLKRGLVLGMLSPTGFALKSTLGATLGATSGC